MDEDMINGDLGNGTRTKPSLGFQRRQSYPCSEGAHWRARANWSHTQMQDMIRADSLAELSKEQLIERLHKATETIQVLESELEVTHRYLEGKYAALKILQGQAILEKATSHTKSLVQKSEKRVKTLEKEVNTLQWELSLSQLRLRTSKEAFENSFYRMLSERNSLSEALKQKELEKEQLQAENLTLSAQYMELLSRVSPDLICPTTKAPQARGPPGIKRAPAPLHNSTESQPQITDREAF